ncbi:hypothetical protein OH76DRAFT_1354129 [Lentinus brumalis]|uniref:DUF6534 domain-containing protein n=1 Tax=Lentinus brumalis TaxID=2498619 RepID=A0A371D4Q0_9APHY|nr:hypothetical protein OH76DRAFT_1354129 [Polyporus brumalis]
MLNGRRSLVYFIFVLELVQTGTTTHQAYYYGVQAFNNVELLLTFPWSAMTVPVMAGIIAFIAQIFYAWRIWALSPNWVLKVGAVLVVLLAILQCGTAIVVSVIFELKRTPEELGKLHPGFETWISASFVCDVFVAICMLWILLRVKSKSIWESSNNVISRLIGITIGTGAAIAICGALTLGLFATTVGLSFQYLPA